MVPVIIGNGTLDFTTILRRYDVSITWYVELFTTFAINDVIYDGCFIYGVCYQLFLGVGICAQVLGKSLHRFQYAVTIFSWR